VKFITVLCVAGFASSVSYRAIDPMLPNIAVDLDVPLRHAALLASAYGFPYAIMQPVLGPIGDGFSKTRLIKLSLTVLMLAVALSAVAPGYGSLMITRVIAGSVSGGIFPIGLALIGDRTALAERQVFLSRLLVSSIFGQMFGASAAGFLAGYAGWRAVFVLVAALTGMAWLIVLLFLKAENEVTHRLTLRHAIDGYRTVLANPSALLVFAAVMAEGIFFFSVFPFAAAMLGERGASGAFGAGLALACFAIGGVFYGSMVRYMLAALGQWGMMRMGGLLAGIAYIAIAAPIGWILVPPLFLVAGFGFYMLHNTLQMRGTEIAPTARASTFALFSACMFTGQGIAPVLGGAILQATGFSALFLLSGIFTVILGLAAAHFIKRRG
jgi:predicted MFS family arabinose efflux permease